MGLDVKNNTVKIVALDPGGTTGVSSIEFDERTHEMREVMLMQLGPHEHHTEIEDVIKDATIVVCEGFEYRNNSRSGLVLVSKEYIGVAKAYCANHDIRYEEQTAAQAKGFISDKALKLLGLYSSDAKHANDATRHLLYFIINGHAVSESIRMPILERMFPDSN